VRHSSALWIDEAIGERLHHLMWKVRITQAAMGPRMGVAQPVLSKKLRGTVTWTARDIIAAAAILGVDAGSLLPQVDQGANEEDPQQPVAAGGQTLPRLDSNQ
jgi:hypothetical protein